MLLKKLPFSPYLGFVILVLGAFSGMAQTVSFTNEIKPIFQASCMSCHGPGGIAPARAWTDSATAYAYAAEIKDRINRIGAGRMPASGALTAQQITLISTWADQVSLEKPTLTAVPRPVTSRPNPCRAQSIIDFGAPLTTGLVEIYDCQGRLADRIRVSAGASSLVWNTGAVQDGVYWAKTRTGHRLLARKITVQK
jgi:hypothetical protein